MPTRVGAEARVWVFDKPSFGGMYGVIRVINEKPAAGFCDPGFAFHHPFHHQSGTITTPQRLVLCCLWYDQRLFGRVGTSCSLPIR